MAKIEDIVVNEDKLCVVLDIMNLNENNLLVSQHLSESFHGNLLQWYKEVQDAKGLITLKTEYAWEFKDLVKELGLKMTWKQFKDALLFFKDSIYTIIDIIEYVED